MSKAEKLAKQLLDLGVDDVRELQSILEQKGFLLGVTIVPDSWMREHGVKPPNTASTPTAAGGSTSDNNSESGGG